MNSQPDLKATIGCLSILIVVILLVTYFTTASFVPFAVYGSNSILAKIIVSLFAVLMIVILTQFFMYCLMIYGIEKVVERKTGERARDVVCPGCGLPLIQFMGSHGVPIVCPICPTAWHNGPACYNKGKPNPRIAFTAYPCPHCRETQAYDEGLFDDEGFSGPDFFR